MALLGHSSGAHLASLATLDPEDFTPHCEDPLVAPDALVGLAGPYDIRTFAERGVGLFARGRRAAEWDAANPVLLAAHQRPTCPSSCCTATPTSVVPARYSRTSPWP